MLKRKSILSIALAMLLVVLVGCGQKETATQLADGGVLCLSVNPEIAVHYDGDGNVTKVEGRNDDGTAIVTDYTGYEGKPTREVVSELITEIGEAGYFVEEVEGARRQITIEIEAGSNLPSPTFLDEIVTDAKANVNSHQWQTPLDVLGESDYG